MRRHPELVAATSGRIDTELMRLHRGLAAKTGAEGSFCVGRFDAAALSLFGPRIELHKLAGRHTGEVRPAAALTPPD